MSSGRPATDDRRFLGILKPSRAGMPPSKLVCRRTYLRPPELSDWQAWATLREQSRTFLEPWEPTWPREVLGRPSFIRRLRRQTEEWRSDSAYAFLVFRTDGDLVGGINVTNVRRGVAQMATLGYWIGAPHRRLGYMTEAVWTACRFCFLDLKLHRVEAACLPQNAASRALLEKIGFDREGYARRYLRINGHWQDHVSYALLQDDFSGDLEDMR